MNRTDPHILNDLQIGQPAWRMALLFPPQGSWTEQEYLALDAGHQIEFDSGCVEVLDLPTKEHQRIVRFLFLSMNAFVAARRLGEVFFAPVHSRVLDGFSVDIAELLDAASHVYSDYSLAAGR